MKRIAPKSKVQDYLFLDRERLALYYDQVPDDLKRSAHDVSKEVGLSITGPSVKLVETKRSRDPSIAEQIDRIRDHLNRSEDLATRRPQEMSYEAPRFVEESMWARKVIIKDTHLAKIEGLKSIAVWISDPDPADLSLLPHRWTGTFLYLVESFWDDGPLSTVYSGCSALQAIANVALGAESIFRTRVSGEPLGRWNAQHPVEKLAGVGGVAQAPRRIRVLYRNRYLTDEQCSQFDGQEYRLNDLLAYPLYIASE
ncbi:MAG: hypothetical protein K1X67_20355 [Fimbriimonadaceae bacterium]|nr:hypothetical protein [Fimbriimonadaceae bacterium]